MQRARDWSRGKREDIDRVAKVLQSFFVLHAKPLFFIDHAQAKVFELNVLRNQPMRANHNIDLARFQFLDRFLELFG